MLSTAKSATVGFWPVLQLFAPPANSARAETSCYKFGKKIIVGVNNVRTNIMD